MRRPQSQPPSLPRADVDAMIANLQARARAQASLAQIVEEEQLRSKDRKAQGLARVADGTLKLGKALYAARRITRDEFIFLLDWAVHDRNDQNLSDGVYAAELTPLDEQMREIEKRHGLTDNQYWLKADFPPDYANLSAAWSAVADRHFLEILNGYGFDDLTELCRNDRAEWDRIVEIGRRLFRRKHEEPIPPTETIRMLISGFEAEAALCETVGAYYAGCAMLGAAAEARLLSACLASPEIAEAARLVVPRERRPKRSDPQAWTFDQLMAVASEAGWTGELQTEDFVFFVDGLAEHLRRSRNYLHPGRHALDRPLAALSGDDFIDARSAYNALRYALEQSEGR